MTSATTILGLEERRAVVGGVQLRYFTRGQTIGGQGVPLVLVHGLGGSAANWVEIVARVVGSLPARSCRICLATAAPVRCRAARG